MLIFTNNPADGVINFDNVSVVFVEKTQLHFRMNDGYTMCIEYNTTARAGLMFKLFVSALVAGKKFFAIKIGR